MPKQLRNYEVYLVHVDAARCDGCGACVVYCPVDVFTVHHRADVVRPGNCLGCETCVAVCKSGAVVVTEI